MPHPYDAPEIIQSLKDTLLQDTRQAPSILIDFLNNDLLPHWSDYNLSRSELNQILNLAFTYLRSTQITILFGDLTEPFYNTSDLTAETRLGSLLQATQKNTHFNSTIKTELKTNFVTSYLNTNPPENLVKQLNLYHFLPELEDFLYALKRAYNNDPASVNPTLLKQLTTAFLKSSITHGNARILQRLHGPFVPEIIATLSQEQKERYDLLCSVTAPCFVTETMQAYTDGAFGELRYQSALVDLAATQDRKPNLYSNVTLLDFYQFETYLNGIKTSLFPLHEYFVIAGTHWLCGEINISKDGSTQIFLLDSLGFSPNPKERYDDNHGYYTDTKIVIDQCNKATSENNMSTNIYFGHYVTQKSHTGCFLFALDNLRHLHRMPKYLPAPFNQETTIFPYLKAHTTTVIKDTKGKTWSVKNTGVSNLSLVDLPFSLLQSAQTGKPELLINERPNEASTPINKKQELPLVAIKKHHTINQDNKVQNHRLQNKRATKERQALTFIAQKDEPTIKSMTHPFSLDHFIERTSALTTFTPETWTTATAIEKLQEMTLVFEKLREKWSRLSSEELKEQLDKNAQIALKHLTPEQTKALLIPLLSKNNPIRLSITERLILIMTIYKNYAPDGQTPAEFIQEYRTHHTYEKILHHPEGKIQKPSLYNYCSALDEANPEKIILLKTLLENELQQYNINACKKFTSETRITKTLPSKQARIFQLLTAAKDPAFLENFMRQYNSPPTETLGLATLAYYAENMPGKLKSSTLLATKKGFEDFVHCIANTNHPLTEYFIFKGAPWIAGVITVDETGLAKMFISDALGQLTSKGKLSSTTQQACNIFQKTFNSDNNPTPKIYLSRTVRHSETADSWLFSLRDIKNLATGRALPKGYKQKGIFEYLEDHPDPAPYNTSGLNLNFSVLPERLQKLSIKKTGSKKHKAIQAIVESYGKTVDPKKYMMLLHYKIIRQGQKMLEFLFNKTDADLKNKTALHTVQGALARHTPPITFQNSNQPLLSGIMPTEHPRPLFTT